MLVTRSAPAAARTAAALAARGFRPVVAPLLRVRTGLVAVPAGTQAVLVASANALPALRTWPAGGPRLLAVGDATASEARAAGHADVLSASGDAGALVRLACRVCDPAGGPLLLASGAGQGAGLAAALAAAGFDVRRQDAYVAEPVEALPEAAAAAIAAGLHAALFLSAETARAFGRLLPASLAPRLASSIAVAIGASAGQALHGLPWRRLSVARHPTLDEVLSLL